jgi:hypothetical protein
MDDMNAHYIRLVIFEDGHQPPREASGFMVIGSGLPKKTLHMG